MTTKLTQRYFLKGTREFEIVNDVVNARIKKLVTEEKLTIGLATLDPEPVVNKPYLEFNSRTGSGAVLSLFLNKPNTEEFNAFVDSLKQRAQDEHNASTGINTSSQPAGLAWNVYDEPPEFEDPDPERPIKIRQPVDATQIDSSIQMLETYLDPENIKSLLSALEAIKEDPQNEAYLTQMERAFNDLGIMQGAVLTYAPYIATLLSDDPFGDY